MSHTDNVLNDVVLAQHATGRWYRPTHKYGLLVLNSVKVSRSGDRYSMRIDVARNRARIYAIGSPNITSLPLIETELNTDAINQGIDKVVSSVEDRVQVKAARR